jgi:hypothetical protein
MGYCRRKTLFFPLWGRGAIAGEEEELPVHAYLIAPFHLNYGHIYLRKDLTCFEGSLYLFLTDASTLDPRITI